MADNSARIIISAVDQTGSAFRSAQAGLSDLQRRAAGLGSSFGGLGAQIAGALSVAGMATFARQVINGLDALNDLRDATGSTVERLSALESVALRNGGTLQDVGSILVKFNQALKGADGKDTVSVALKAIGLGAKELRSLDPAEALQRTAVALQGFADDGNKARIVQELFGKSIKEAAPFLKDLAEAGQINATVTAEQAEEAERFNKQMFRMRETSTQAGRAIVSEVLPALNEFADRLRGVNNAATENGGLARALLVPLETVAVLGVNVAYVFKQIGNEIGGIAAQAAALVRGDFAGAKAIGQQMRADAEAARAAIDERTRQLLGLSAAQQKVTQGAVGIFDANDARALRRPSLPDTAGASKAAAAAAKMTTGLADLRAETLKQFLQSQKQDNLLEGYTGPKLEDTAFYQNTIKLGQALASTPTFKLEQLRGEMLALADAFQTGQISAEQFSEIAQTKLGILPEKLKPAIEEATEFTKQFAANVQNAMGDTVLATLRGDFDNIGKLWGDLLLKMAAQAIAADIGNALFGKLQADGTRGGGGLFASFLSLFGFAKGGAFAKGMQITPFAAGGVVSSPTLFPMRNGMGLMGEAGPEAVMPLKRGRDGRLGVAGGGTTNIVYNVSAGVTRNELVTALQMLRQTVNGDMIGALRARGLA